MCTRRQVFIDGIEKRVPLQPFNLLVMLAKALLHGSGVVSKDHIESATSGRSAADLVRELRARLAAAPTGQEQMRDLIESRRGPTVYYLALSAKEVEMQP
jgi:hypothetical protein